MTVLFVSRCLPVPAFHGDRLILGHLLRGLRARGHRTIVVALAQPGDEAHLDESRASCDRLEVVAERRRGALDFAARLARPFPAEAAGCWHPDLFAAAARAARDHAPGVAHFFGGIQVSECRRAVGEVPTLIAPYESHTLWVERAAADAAGWRERVTWRLRAVAVRAFERRIHRGFGRVVVLTAVDAARLVALDPSLPVRVIPNGVEAPERVTPVEDRREPLVVFTGNFSYEPNARAAARLVHAVMPRVRARLPAARLALVGARVPRGVEALQRRWVQVAAGVPSVWPWLQRARAFVSPLSRGAGMKNKVLEALAAGAPLVATPQSCDGIGVVDGEHAALAADDEGLARATCRVLEDATFAAAIAGRGRALVQRQFTWVSVVEAYERLYAELGAS